MRKKEWLKYSIQKYQPGVISYKNKPERIRIKRILELCEPGKRMLDIGCYDGTLAVLIGKQFGYKEIWGIEISPKVAFLAEKRGVRVKIQDFEERFHFKNNFFDLVVAGEVIEHVVDTDRFIQEVKRVLKPKGVLVLSTPNIASLGRRLFLFLGKNPYFEASFTYPPEATSGHLRFFAKDLLFGFLSFHQFKVVKFVSDIVNFDSKGRLGSVFLAQKIPTLGRSLIIKAVKHK
jgi:SAM-dependent methyltransferase